ncbi:MAG: MOSC N-terminal beta barrel domain-containing protein [Gemmatimonadales bacterium]|nr:MOSC N-terminal beta barrel domain-containing protein [Gemmatimonadales bacterium]
MPSLELPLHPSETVTASVTVWDDTCSATWVGERAARWFSQFLGIRCSLVHMSKTLSARLTQPSRRPVRG